MTAPAPARVPWLEGEVPERLEAKRLDFGVELVGNCPVCARVFRRDTILTNPTVNVDTAFNCYCPGCDHEWKVPARITVRVELLP